MNLTANIADQIIEPNTSNIEGDKLKSFVLASGSINSRRRQRFTFLTDITTGLRTGSCDLDMEVVSPSQHDLKNDLVLHWNRNLMKSRFTTKAQEEFWVSSNNAVVKLISANTKAFCTILIDSKEPVSRNFVVLDQLNFKSTDVGSSVEIFLSKVQKLDQELRKQEAIKQAHKLVDALLGLKSFELLNEILDHVSKSKMTLPVLVAFLASTKRFKGELPNRSQLFNSAENLAMVEIGAEKLSRSIFSNLK